MSEPQPGSSPAYTIVAEQRPGYLRVVMSGLRTTPEASIAGWRAVGAKVAERHALRVLVVSRLTGPMPTPAEQMRIIQDLIGYGFEGVRLAFVLEEATRLGDLEHGEIYSRELGQESRVFGSEPIAELWLLHGTSRKEQVGN